MTPIRTDTISYQLPRYLNLWQRVKKSRNPAANTEGVCGRGDPHNIPTFIVDKCCVAQGAQVGRSPRPRCVYTFCACESLVGLLCCASSDSLNITHRWDVLWSIDAFDYRFHLDDLYFRSKWELISKVCRDVYDQSCPPALRDG